VCLNCAALPEALLESELFGHERGAFTGAVQTKQGLLEAAEGGTVFLDEIGEMPLTVQAKLLRVMEDKAVRPVGGRQHRPIRARFVFATNRKLNEEMSRGAFRADLYHRLSGAVLSVPPLRNRPREIEPLARLFLTRAAREAGQNWPPRLAPETLECLSTHTWPGNIRELRNVMERAMLVCGGDEVRLEHLPGELTAREAVALDQPPAVPDALGREDLLRVVGGREPLGLGSRSNAIADDERQRIMRALELCAGNQTRAARLLEISRATLIRRLAAYGFARPRSPEQVCALPGRSD
jgi:DNA-binding NtrC family response regulator